MKELDLTQGSVPKVLLQFALPFLLANLLQALYGGADLFVVGLYDDAASVAGVAIGSQVMQTVTGIILGLTTGTTILIALQDALVNVSFLLITVIVNQMGVIASAALGVVEKIITFAMLPPMAISSAVAAMTAQNYGAGLIRRMNLCLRSGIGMALVFGVSVCAYSQFLPETLTGIFTHDPAVVAMGADYLRGYSIDCIIVSFVFCINSYFSGQGNSWFPMVHSLIATFLFRIPLSWAFSHIDPSSLFWMGYAPAATCVSLLICFWYLRRQAQKQAQ